MKVKEKILILGSGPIKIGQACEFDYSGTQACKALKERGYEVVLINSNPATIMTDPNIADKVYIEPLEKTYVEAVIKKERPDKLIPTLGGQTALNLALELDGEGILKKYNLDLIGATPRVIKKAEDRQLFNNVLTKVGARFAKSFMATSFEQGLRGVEDFEFPVILRPNYTLGGSGGGVCYSLEEYRQKLSQGLHESPTSEVLVEQSLLGWKEFELEVIRDKEGTFVIICSIENVDPCGVHTGDSITVAPQQTLSDKAYQEMRTEAKRIIEEVGVETGGANIQFAVHPTTGERVVIEMNPRVSRSSALASKATGFPIAKIAALLAVGETLDELKNDITKTTPSSYEPALDYVVTKIPKFNFEKFLGSKDQLSTQMRSVGEVMSLGRTFKESFVKAFRSLEGTDLFLNIYEPYDKDKITYPNSQRVIHLFRALAQGVSVENLHDWTKITPWFLEQFEEIVKFYAQLSNDLTKPASDPTKLTNDLTKPAGDPTKLTNDLTKPASDPTKLTNDLTKPASDPTKLTNDLTKHYRKAKQMGLSDSQIKNIISQTTTSQNTSQTTTSQNTSQTTTSQNTFQTTTSQNTFQTTMQWPSLSPSYFQVDTCAGEFKSSTPYLYSTYWSKAKVKAKADVLVDDQKQKTYVVIGSGPNRIGQGIEFDYCCVRAAQKLKALGHRVVMINSNPETVSTDYDTSDMLFFEPLDEEGVLNVLEVVQPEAVFCQFGGQTPIHLARAIQSKGYNLAGTPLSVIDQAEDRHQFAQVCDKVGARVPKSTLANSFDELGEFLNEVPYPLMCRPSYVIGGQSMEVVENDEDLFLYFNRHERNYGKTNPCFVDQFLEGALEVDVDLVCFRDRVVVAGIVEHIEVAGVHSGDSMGVLPPQRLKWETRKTIEDTCLNLVKVLGVLGLLNVQLAIKNNEVFIIEANPRASRTIPFIAKARGVSFVDYAVLAMLGEDCPTELLDLDWSKLSAVCVKGVVFPFKKFPDSDSILGPQMKSTGESMGRGEDYPTALLKAFIGADYPMPQSGRVLLSLRDKDKQELLPSIKILVNLGFILLATKGTAELLKDQGLECELVNKVLEGRPHCVDRIRSGEVALVVNTTSGKDSIKASYSIRRSCLDFSVPCLTESEAAKAYILALRQKKAGQLSVQPLSLSI